MGFVLKPRSDGRNRKFAKCVCECGTEKEVMYKDLKNGKSKSCGCLQKEKASIIGKAKRTHELTDTKEYRSWAGLRNRCSNPRNKHYKEYGGRGVTVCTEWGSFEQFLVDMGNAPSPQYSVERTDNSKGYSKSNCIWATAKTQANNRRNNALGTIEDVTRTISEWCDYYKTPSSRVYARLKYGWELVDALTIPKINTGNKHVRNTTRRTRSNTGVLRRINS